ncbi:SRPBCC family protein [Oceanihabitans sediminis]|uniref:SRPBCC family protein n=1 Tax=Oceanihabitans sediminis TaxID=1812012 RepID=UPI00299E73B3|nr:SRPBCC family protein [Oceanihabitans sediminis]MDX1279216.1 SRPBCC family protein [Oceanihabitans sediminis]
MKTLKKILIVIGIIIAIPLVAALFIKQDYAVEEEIIINAPKSEVFAYIKQLKNQDHFSKWASIDPNMKKTYTGTDGQVGFISAWESEDENVGAGEQEIINITEGERIDFELRFFKPFQSTEAAYMITENVAQNQTKVKWGFTGRSEYPSNLFLIFMDFEKMVGDDFQTGLQNLKNILENNKQ